MIVFMVTLLFSQANYAAAQSHVVTQLEPVTISISVEEPVYLLVPTIVNILVTDSKDNPISGISGMVFINDTLFTSFITSESGFSFTWIPEEPAVYILKVVTMKTENYAAGEQMQPVTVRFSFEELLNEAISELEYIKDHYVLGERRIEKKIFTIEKDIRRALKYCEKGDYFKAFLRVRHATHLIEKLLKHPKKLEEDVLSELEHIAYKLVVAVRYKVKESLEYAEGFEGCAKTPGKPKKIKTSSEVLLDRAWRFYDRGVSEISAERYSKAISRFIVAYRLVMIVLRCGKHG